MSDRIGVVQQRPARAGRPRRARSTPRRRRASSRNFVGAANVLDGDAARRLAGADGSAMLRPERIAVGAAERRPGQRHGDRGAVLRFVHAAARRRRRQRAAGRSARPWPKRPLAVRPCTCIGTSAPFTGCKLGRRHDGRAGAAGIPVAVRAPPRIGPALYAARLCCCCCCSRRRCCGSASSTSARCSRCWPTRSSASTTTPARCVREFTLDNFRRAGRSRPTCDVAARTVSMAALVTLACALLAFPVAYYMARHARGTQEGAALHRGDAAAVVELPGAAVRVEAAAGQGRRDLVAGGAAARSPGCSKRCCDCRWSADRA